jgi:hypothetical protein
MTQLVSCSTHGKCESTIVCEHVAVSLRDGVARGFHWLLDEDNEYQAVCKACHEMPRDKFEVEAVGKVLCLECYKRAALLNGIVSSEIEGARP